MRNKQKKKKTREKKINLTTKILEDCGRMKTFSGRETQILKIKDIKILAQRRQEWNEGGC